jgi:NTE family protein
VASRARDLTGDLARDVGFLELLRRSALPSPFDWRAAPERDVFAGPSGAPLDRLAARRVGIVATGGSGAMASLVGVGRAFEDAGIRPAVISVCSGSALFGFPLAAGIPAAEVAEFTASLRGPDYVDVDWPLLASIGPRAARGFAGVIKGDRLESVYRELLGDCTLGELPIPAHAPIWNVERNVSVSLGPASHPDLPVARAVRLAVALPLFVQPVPLDGGHWCDGGLVDIFPVGPLLDEHPMCDTVVAVNGFYPPDFEGEDASGWESKLGSILHVASQVRTSQQIELAREHLRRLRASTRVLMLDPVPYQRVRGLGFYRQFLDTSEWPDFMRAGRAAARQALEAEEARR